MNNFWNLVGFEYKKIVMKKSVWIAFAVAILTAGFSCFGVIIGSEYAEGVPVVTKYESMVMDRDYARRLSGREVNTELIMEAVKAYQKLPVNEERYTMTEEYQTYARAYSEIYGLVRLVYNKTLVPDFRHENLSKLTKEQADQFYEFRSRKVVGNIKSLPLNENSKEKLLTLDEKVEKPFIFEYTGGYDRYLALLYTSGLMAAFLIAIYIAPIFAGEYQSGSDQLILSSRNGKKSLISAKIFTALSLTAIITSFISAITYFGCMLVYGFDGANAPLQVKLPLSTYPLSLGETALIFTVCILFACILVASVTMFLSSKFKSAFGVIILISLLLIVPMFINVPQRIASLYKLSMLLPSNMMGLWNITSPMLYEVFGASIEPYIFMPIVSTLVSIAVLPFAYKGFQKHQVG